VVKRKEKAIVWSLYPLEQLIIREIFVSFGIDTRVLASDLTQGQKSDLVKNFNSPDVCQVLIASYTANGAGLNLQQSCHNVHLFDPAPSANAQEQAIGRTYRLGQPRKVTVVEYYVRRTFNEKVVNTQILRALPGLMAMIDKD
ncbi:P-loop containing nucleoside triphosphate hydrolase protein, partial [Cenococcum geophilum]